MYLKKRFRSQTSKKFAVLLSLFGILFLYNNCSGQGFQVMSAASSSQLASQATTSSPIGQSTTSTSGTTTDPNAPQDPQQPTIPSPTSPTAPPSDPTTLPVASAGKIYYLAPASLGGSDLNSGTSTTSAWLSPNHALNCGDTILAASSSAYDPRNFAAGSWGNVSCSSAQQVAWLKCAAFDTCKISASQSAAMQVSASFWGVQGWEATSSGAACFVASPLTASSNIHHIIFANNIANACQNTGIGSFPFGGATGPSGVDYIAIIGNLVFNAAQGASECFSGISIYEPRNSDRLSGTHVYVAQNISWGNIDSPTCPGNSDGEGIIFDDWTGDQSLFTSAYSGQGVIENNILVGNGGAGLEVYHNTASNIFVLHNTSFGNNLDPHRAGTYNGEILISMSSSVNSQYNLTGSTTAVCCTSSQPVYGFYGGFLDSTSSADFNWFYGAGQNNTQTDQSSGFVFGSHNIVGQNPMLNSSVTPSGPQCSGAQSALGCASSIIANFASTLSRAGGYGYQPVTSTYAANPNYPAWLCQAGLPNGIISNYCQ